MPWHAAPPFDLTHRLARAHKVLRARGARVAAWLAAWLGVPVHPELVITPVATAFAVAPAEKLLRHARVTLFAAGPEPFTAHAVMTLALALAELHRRQREREALGEAGQP